MARVLHVVTPSDKPRTLLEEQTIAALGILAFGAEAAERFSDGMDLSALPPFVREKMRKASVALAATVADIQSNLTGLRVR